MKKIVFCVLMVFAAGMMATWSARADGEQDSVALTKRAAMFIKEQGREKGLAEIMNAEGVLKKGGTVVTATDFAGVCLADPAHPELVGQNRYDLNDPDNKYYIREAIRIAKTRGSGWLEWSFVDPRTEKTIRLNAWIQRVEGMDMFVMAPVPLEKKWYHITLIW